MDLSAHPLVVLIVLFEVVQLLIFAGFVQHRYGLSLRQLERLTQQLAAGIRVKSYYIAGPPRLEETTRHLETISARLEALERRRQEEDFNLQVLLANMVEGVMVVDARHNVRLVNDELVRLFDLKQSPVGQTVLESLREARVEIIVRETLAGGEPRQHETVLERAAMRHFEISAVPIRTNMGEVGGAVLVFHDITRIKQLEVVRSEFVANVSHELRTPLAIFRGYLETLRDHPELPKEETTRILAAMERNSHRLHALVEDLLALTRLESRQEPMEFVRTEMAPFFAQLMSDWEKRAGTETAEIELQLAPELPALEINPLRFEQVILNLLENAVAYSSAPRRIIIGAKIVDGWMEWRVTDNGVGIPPADLPFIFQRFYRVDKGRGRNSGGTGLGLSIVRTIIESHGGTVAAESRLGQGTTIVVRLPLQQKR